jgi:hypothetical protein
MQWGPACGRAVSRYSASRRAARCH